MPIVAIRPAVADRLEAGSKGPKSIQDEHAASPCNFETAPSPNRPLAKSSKTFYLRSIFRTRDLPDFVACRWYVTRNNLLSFADSNFAGAALPPLRS